MRSRIITMVTAGCVLGVCIGLPPSATPQVLEPATAVGKAVRVTGRDGSRATGRLVSLSDAQVVVRRRGSEEHLLLEDVQRIERVRHPIRNGAMWAAGVAGATAAAMTPLLESDPNDSVVGFVLGYAGFAGAVGAGVGVLIKVATRRENTLYERQEASRAIVSPVVLPQHQAIAFRLTWP